MMTSSDFTLLVANRGEIALRVMRTARSMGLRTVAVYSDADAGAPHVRFADDAVRIGPGPVGESYLNTAVVIEAAKATGAQAIHPGYGFLSENADFVRMVEEAGLVFVGPTVEAVEAMGDKARAKRKMIDAGVPCVPGYEGEDQSEARLIEAAEKVGFPVMVKASAGGGGRGMRLVHAPSDLPQALSLARSEAENAFGSGDLIIEKAILRPRHVEIQVFADTYGHTIHLGERDCSVQRRHQKVIEEALCPVLTPELRDRMGSAAVAAAKAVAYRGAGTVEFLLDADANFYFLEMNTRLQVEHPVTELVTGLDLVELQLRVAQGERLPISQEDVRFEGWAIEVRLYAEDPANDFLPSTGEVELWKEPEGPGVRVDAGIETGSKVSPFYDAMVAKIMAGGRDREEARRRLVRALSESALFGLANNRDFLIACLEQPAFRDGQATTAFIAESFGEGGYRGATPASEDYLIAAAVQRHLERTRHHQRSLGVHPDLLDWSSDAFSASVHTYVIEGERTEIRATASGSGLSMSLGDQVLQVNLLSCDGPEWRFSCDGQVRRVVAHALDERTLWLATEACSFRVVEVGGASADTEAEGGGRVSASMHGKLTELFVEEGQPVEKGGRLAVLEAMKMQFEIVASISGTVKSIHAKPGAQIGAEELILEIEPS